MEYIYILINPSIPGQVKIGKTTNTPEQRAKELSTSTGVPTSFIVAYESIVNDCTSAEKEIHLSLESQGYRVNVRREFFEIPLKIAVDTVNIICAKYEISDEDIKKPISQISISDSGKAIYYEVLSILCDRDINEVDFGYRQTGYTHRIYYYSDNHNEKPMTDFPVNLIEKLELSKKLGCKQAEGWLLYIEACKYFFGYRKLQDTDLYIDKIIESFACGFQGAYSIVSNWTTIKGDYSPTGMPESVPEVSLATKNKMDKLTGIYDRIVSIEQQKYSDFSRYLEIQAIMKPIRFEAGIQILKRAINAGETDLCAKFFFSILELTCYQMATKYSERIGSPDAMRVDSRFFLPGPNNKTLIKHSNIDDDFRAYYTDLLSIRANMMKQGFQLYLTSLRDTEKVSESHIYRFLDFFQAFSISLTNTNFELSQFQLAKIKTFFNEKFKENGYDKFIQDGPDGFSEKNIGYFQLVKELQTSLYVS